MNKKSIPGVPMVTIHDADLVCRKNTDGRGRLRHAMTELRGRPAFEFGQTGPNHESSPRLDIPVPSTAVGGGRLAGGGTPEATDTFGLRA